MISLSHNSLSIFIVLFCACQAFASDENVSPRPYGAGNQYPHEYESWDGAEKIVTKIEKGDVTYLLSRTSKDIFEIKTQAVKAELFFRLDLNVINQPLLSPYDVKLVDVYRDNNSISALLFGNTGYYLVNSSLKKLASKKGEFLFFSKIVKIEKWNIQYDVAWLDFYQDDHMLNCADSKISSIKLTGLNKIECIYKRRKDKTSAPDLFLIEGDKLIKNGVAVWPVYRSMPIDEVRYLKDLDSASDENVRTIVVKYAENKDNFLKIILENSRDPKNYEAIKARVDKAFENWKPGNSE